MSASPIFLTKYDSDESLIQYMYYTKLRNLQRNADMLRRAPLNYIGPVITYTTRYHPT